MSPAFSHNSCIFFIYQIFPRFRLPPLLPSPPVVTCNSLPFQKWHSSSAQMIEIGCQKKQLPIIVYLEVLQTRDIILIQEVSCCVCPSVNTGIIGYYHFVKNPNQCIFAHLLFCLQCPCSYGCGYSIYYKGEVTVHLQHFLSLFFFLYCKFLCSKKICTSYNFFFCAVFLTNTDEK